MDAEYARSYAELYRTHWWWRSRERFLVSALDDIRTANGWHCALDVGCGDGLFLDRLSRYADTVEGLESDPTVVSPEATERHTIHLGNLDRSFVPGCRYDLVCMLDVLEHIQDPVPALRRVAELMEPGGTLLVTVPAFQSLWTSHDDVNHHHARYTRSGLRTLVREAGFVPGRALYFFHWLFPVKLIVRATEKLARRQANQVALPPPWANRLLCSLSTTEQALLTPLRLPFGSSLLLTARLAGPATHATSEVTAAGALPQDPRRNPSAVSMM